MHLGPTSESLTPQIQLIAHALWGAHVVHLHCRNTTTHLYPAHPSVDDIHHQRVDVIVSCLEFVWRKKSLFSGQSQSFLLRLSTDWVTPTHVMEGQRLTQSPLIRTWVSSKTPFTATSRLVFAQITGHQSPAKLASKINHYIPGAFYPCSWVRLMQVQWRMMSRSWGPYGTKHLSKP